MIINYKRLKTLMSISRTSPNMEIGHVIVEAKLSLRNAVCPKRDFSKSKKKRKGSKGPKTLDLRIDFQYFLSFIKTINAQP